MSYFFGTILSLALFAATAPAAGAQKPSGLMTDLLADTETVYIGGYPSTLRLWEIDKATENVQYAAVASAHPSFTWIVPDGDGATRQISYEIVLSDNREDISEGRGNVWESGMVASPESVSVIYAGPALAADKVYFWRVRTVTDSGGESPWSDIAAFRTAKTLPEHATSAYPLVKSAEYPLEKREAGDNAVLFDFGRDAFGQLLLTLTSESGGDTVAVHLGERLDDGRISRNPGGTVRYRQYPLRLARGTHTYRVKITEDGRNTGPAAVLMPRYIGEVMPFRYCEVEGYDGDIRPCDVTRESVHYPFDEAASSFRCSDDLLNRIWDLCKYSIKATSFTGIYVDGDRERIPYEADALINQLSHYGVDREYSMARRSHEYLLERPTWPTEWILQSIIMAWNDYMYTGDARSLRANYDVLKARSLGALKTDNGLISTTTGLQTDGFKKSIRFDGDIRDIVDWPHTGILGLSKDEGGEVDGFVFTDYNAVVNAFHYRALELLGRIADALELPGEAASFNKEAADFREIYLRNFYMPREGRFRDGITTDHAALHSNMMPLALGIVPQRDKGRVAEFIRSRRMACSVYGSQFLLDAAYEAGDGDYALERMTATDDRSWYNMIKVGSTITLEAWDDKYKPNQDWNHAWGAAPANVIPRKLIGVEPLTPGFAVAQIKPQLGQLAWAEALVPTIRGGIDIKVVNDDGYYTVEFTLPANMDAEIYLPAPQGKYRTLLDGEAVKASRTKDGPFIGFGRVGSGRHTVIVEKR